MPARSVRIDTHHHFWDPADFHYPWMEGAALDPVRRPFTPADLSPALTACGIDGTVLVQTLSSLTETRLFPHPRAARGHGDRGRAARASVRARSHR